jgi:hypothetical protein
VCRILHGPLCAHAAVVSLPRPQFFHHNLSGGPPALNGYFKFFRRLRLSLIKPIVNHGLDNTHSTISSSNGHQTMRDQSKSASLEQLSAGLRDRTAVISLGYVRLQLM